MSSHSLPSLFQRPHRQASRPARYDDYVMEYDQRPQHTTELPEPPPLHSADICGVGPQYQSQSESEEDQEPPQLSSEEDEEEEPEPLAEPAMNPRSPVPSGRALAPEYPHVPHVAPIPDRQTELLQQLLDEVKNQGRLIHRCMLDQGHSLRSRSVPFPETFGPPLVASQAQHAAMPPQATTRDTKPFPAPPRQQLPYPPPISHAPASQPLVQYWQHTIPSDNSQFPVTGQVPVSRNPLLPAYMSSSEIQPRAMAHSAQPAYQPQNVQPHHHTSAASPSHLAPPLGRLHPYSKIEGPSFPDLTREDESQYMMLKMALSNLLDPGESEQYKYHILLDHLKVDQAKRLALAYVYAQD